MDIRSFVGRYTLQDILEIEKQDGQFTALQQARNTIQEQEQGYHDKESRKIFLSLIIQAALVSYQIAGTGPQRWKEFASRLMQDFHLLRKLEDTTQRRYTTMTTSKFNKRLYNIKAQRISRYNRNFLPLYEQNYKEYYSDLIQCNKDIALAMNQTQTSKTVTFATKMFGYGLRIVGEPFTHYPYEIAIPLDSRLRRIYASHEPVTTDYHKMQHYFDTIAQEHKIPALHLDSLLWIVYRKTHM